MLIRNYQFINGVLRLSGPAAKLEGVLHYLGTYYQAYDRKSQEYVDATIRDLGQGMAGEAALEQLEEECRRLEHLAKMAEADAEQARQRVLKAKEQLKDGKRDAKKDPERVPSSVQKMAERPASSIKQSYDRSRSSKAKARDDDDK